MVPVSSARREAPLLSRRLPVLCAQHLSLAFPFPSRAARPNAELDRLVLWPRAKFSARWPRVPAMRIDFLRVCSHGRFSLISWLTGHAPLLAQPSRSSSLLATSVSSKPSGSPRALPSSARSFHVARSACSACLVAGLICSPHPLCSPCSSPRPISLSSLQLRFAVAFCSLVAEHSPCARVFSVQFLKHLGLPMIAPFVFGVRLPVSACCVVLVQIAAMAFPVKLLCCARKVLYSP